MALRTSKLKDRKFSFLCKCLAAKNVGPKTFSLSVLTTQRMESGVTVLAHETQLEVTTIHNYTSLDNLWGTSGRCAFGSCPSAAEVVKLLQRTKTTGRARLMHHTRLHTPRQVHECRAENKMPTFLLHRCPVIPIYYYYHHHHLLYAGYLHSYSWDKLCP